MAGQRDPQLGSGAAPLSVEQKGDSTRPVDECVESGSSYSLKLRWIWLLPSVKVALQLFNCRWGIRCYIYISFKRVLTSRKNTYTQNWSRQCLIK